MQKWSNGDTKIVGALMNKVVYLEETKNIPGFPEALETERNNFMWDILNLMDQLYKVNFKTNINIEIARNL